MISLLLSLAALAVATYNNCSGFSSSTDGSTSGLSTPVAPAQYLGHNAFAVSIGSFNSQGSPNVPMVSAIICIPGTANCTLIDNLLLDSGSQGLRVYASALPSGFYSSLTKSGIGECILFAGNNIMWGQTSPVTVELGQEMSSTVYMQIVDQTFGDSGTACMNNSVQVLQGEGQYDANNPPFFDPGTSYNGIVGVNYIVPDCGASCAGSSNSNNGIYYSCSGGTCSSTAVAIAQQVSNPVASMPYDNNGITIVLPQVTAFESTAVSGMAYLGVGTQSNNMPTGSEKVFTASTDLSNSCYSSFRTTWNGSTTCAYMDTGSSCYFFPNSTSNAIAVDSGGDYNPSSPLTLTATMIGMNGVSLTENFVVASPDAAQSGTVVIPYWGVEEASSQPFDWGLPFFFGKTVFVGNQNATTAIGAGPYYAY